MLASANPGAVGLLLAMWPERRQAVQEAKQAVRAYAREPSRANADAVELAWRKVRQCDTLAEWRWGDATVSPPARAADPTA